MINVTFITVGTLKEDYLRVGFSKYVKRIKGFCEFKVIELKESKISDNPNDKEIEKTLLDEAKKIFEVIPKKAYKIAMCVEGQQMTSIDLAQKLDSLSMEYSDICFIIGSSYGLHNSIKMQSNLKLSISKLTFPHQLMRVILSEAVYRAFTIIKGTKYHK